MPVDELYPPSTTTSGYAPKMDSQIQRIDALDVEGDGKYLTKVVQVRRGTPLSQKETMSNNTLAVCHKDPVDLGHQHTPLSSKTETVPVANEYASTEIYSKIHPEEWEVQTLIARGGFGEVNLVMLAGQKHPIAVKICDANTQSLRESKRLAHCQSDFVIRLLACVVHSGRRYICMTYYRNGDLWLWITKDHQRKYFGEAEAIWLTSYILAAVQYIHEKRILHLDIKPGNILFDNNGYPLLGDFGAAIHFSERSHGGIAFTQAYASPEVLECKMPGQLDDLWATACTFHEVVEGNPPSFGKTRNFLGITPNVTKMSSVGINFIERQFRLSRQQRLGYTTGASAVMEHPIFENVDWDDVKYGTRANKSPILRIIEKLEEIDDQLRARQQTVTIHCHLMPPLPSNDNR